MNPVEQFLSDNGRMALNDAGLAAAAFWCEIPSHFLLTDLRQDKPIHILTYTEGTETP